MSYSSSSLSGSSSSSMMSLSRSKPIAIKHDDQHYLEEDNEHMEQEEKQFYESATWRMYNRIVDHRLHTPPQQRAAPIYDGCSPSQVNASSHVNCSPVHNNGLIRPKPRYATPVFMTTTGAMNHVMNPSSSTDGVNVTDDSDMPLFDGEVFELDL